ncbi:MAG: GTPase HflX, partial [Ruminococcus sp.]|nr:GTPase HflX [Ruminococcus sp.]
ISSPEREQQADVTRSLLSELGCDGIPQINVMNKADISGYSDTVFENDNTVLISAREQTGFDRLLECIIKNLPETSRRMNLLIPYDKTFFINRIRIDGKVFSEEYRENGTLIDALVDIKLIKEAENYSL